MKFWKMNGAGNDFIVINNLEEKIPEEKLPILAKTLCKRGMSIGADGLMVVDAPKQGGDYRMLFLNSDGSFGEMCGNGARCICRYGYENGLAGETPRVETTAGIVTGQRISQRQYRIRLNDPCNLRQRFTVHTDERLLYCNYVELGNPGIPHAVMEIQNLQDFKDDQARSLGKFLRYYQEFPKGANVNFYDVIGDDTIYVKTYERGVEDFTLACGTGSGSTVYVLTQQGKVSGHNVHVRCDGGDLTVDVEDDGLYLTGPTNIVAKGEICDEDLHL